MFQKKPLVNERELSIQPGVGTREKARNYKAGPTQHGSQHLFKVFTVDLWIDHVQFPVSFCVWLHTRQMFCGVDSSP